VNAPSHDFEGLDNFRDFGGRPAGVGMRTRRGRLFRSAQHSRLSDRDLESLHALGIEAIVDLRLPAERRKQPSRRHPAFSGRVIESDHGAAEDNPWRLFVQRSGGFTAEQMREWQLDWYRRAAFERQHIELFGRYFAELEQARGAVLIHCAAGKDRTGLLAALTHHLLGVPDQHIVHDYLLTNNEATFARYQPTLVAMVASASGVTPDAAALRAAIFIEPAYLQAAFTAIADQYASLDAYLERALGVSPARRAAIRARLLEPAPTSNADRTA
jgi:protein tyrosine/serine phosphatase